MLACMRWVLALATVALGTSLATRHDVGAHEPGPPCHDSPAASSSAAGEDQRLSSNIDAAVDRGLKWLAMHQERRGCWIGDVGHKQQDSYLVYHSADRQMREGTGHVGVTAMAGLAFLAHGSVP